ncbi:MAG: MFS transporter [Chloroherpetonaceae bacterium]|nr:MFS transporter [Chloroherpetonaceae bacterium]MDW8437807.1 MFS transporter [Chloroherpetonaceae bacterium]
MEQAISIEPARTRVGGYAWYALGLLTFVYLLNFLDRMLIYILFTPIKKEMSFSDVELALLSSTSFVIFYTLLGIPFGRLADKIERKKMIALGLAAWSVFSGMTGFATDFWTIFACRVMVGVGEATLGPAALSLLSDFFPKRIRATAQGIYSSAIAVGSGLAFLLGGWIADAMGWRYAFYLLGFPGALVAIFVFLLKEPTRGESETKSEAKSEASLKELFKTKTLWLHHLGYAIFNVGSASIGAWLTVYFARVHKLSLSEIGLWFGVAMMTGGVAGMILGGRFADKFRKKQIGGRMLVASVSALASAAIWAMMLLGDDAKTLLALNVAMQAFALSWLGPSFADLNDIVEPKQRGLAVGVYFFIVNVAGYGIAPLVIGRLNDAMNVVANPDAMRLSLAVCPAASAVAALVLWLGSREMNSRYKEASP